MKGIPGLMNFTNEGYSETDKFRNEKNSPEGFSTGGDDWDAK